jgi:phage/plasmid-associated DNA primase
VIGHYSYTNYGLAEPPALRVATDPYYLSSDVIGRLIAERCYPSPAASTRAGELYAEWKTWATRDSATPMSRNASGLALEVEGYPSDKTRSGWYRRGIGLLVVGGPDA